MFGFKKHGKENNLSHHSDSQVLSFFGVQHCVKIVNEIEESEECPKEVVEKLIMLLSETAAIEQAIKTYVNEHYYQIIEDYYLDLCYPSKESQEYKEHIALVNDFEYNTINHEEILIKNIKPIYYAIVSPAKAYLFLYLNDSDEYGIDVNLLPQISIRKHDEIE